MQKRIEVSIFYISLPLSFFAFIMPLYAHQLGASPIEIGYLFSIFSFFSVIMRPLVGKYIDRWGRKGAFILGLIFYASVQGVLFVTSTYQLLFVARILQSVASSFLWISSYAMIADLSEDGQYAGRFGSLMQVSNQGDTLGCIIGFSILFSGQIEDPYKVIFGIFSLASIYGVIKGLKIKETQRVELNHNYEEKIPHQFKLYILVVGFLALVQSMLAPVFLIYIKENITQSILLISLAYLPGELLANFLPKKVGKLADQYGRKKFMILGMLIDAFIVCMIPFAKTIYAFVLITIGFSLGSIFISPAETALVSEMTHGNQFGKTYGVYHTVLGLGGMVGPIIGTIIYQNLSSHFLFYLNGIVSCAMVVIINMVVKEKPIERFEQKQIYSKV